ncbi:MAG TPA: LamG domain-containing protein [Polyangiales bacterium]
MVNAGYCLRVLRVLWTSVAALGLVAGCTSTSRPDASVTPSDAGAVCPDNCAPDHVTKATCFGGLCGYEACVDGWGDCDGTADNGCEKPLDSLANCGGCGVACDYEFSGAPRTLTWTWPFDPHSRTRIIVAPEANHRGLFSNGEVISLSSLDSTCNSRIRVFNLQNHTIADGPGAALPLLPAGHYFAECDSYRVEFFVAPPDSTQGHIGLEGPDTRLVGGPNEFALAMKTTYSRTGCTWADVEGVARGQFDWGNAAIGGGCDQTMALLTQTGVKPLLQNVGMRPPWLTDDADYFPALAEYIQALLARFPGKIWGLEVWNEPTPGCTFGGSTNILPRLPNLLHPNYCNLTNNQHWSTGQGDADGYFEALVAVSRAIHDTAKAIEPNIQIVGPAWQDINDYGGGWLQASKRLVELGEMDVLDAYSWHDYGMYYLSPDESLLGRPLGDTLRIDQRVETLRAYGMNKPFHVDEVGFYGKSPLGNEYTDTLGSPPTDHPWDSAMAMAAKAAIMYRAAGAEATYGHILFYDNRDELCGQEFGPLNDAGQPSYGMARGPHPKVSGYLAANNWVSNATFVEKRVLEDGLFLYAWDRPGGDALVFAWTQPSAPKKALAHPLVAQDLFGTRILVTALGEEPVFFWRTRVTARALIQQVEDGLHDCGNGLREILEECDKADLHGQSCGSLGFEPGVGALGCTAACRFDSSSCQLATTGLKGAWSFEDFTTDAGATAFVDGSGNGNSATCTGSHCPTAGVPGVVGHAVQFNATNETRLDVGPISTATQDKHITYAMWIKLTAGTSLTYDDLYTLVGLGYGTGVPWFGLEGGYFNGIVVTFFDSVGVRNIGVVQHQADILTDGSWHHLACVVDADVAANSTAVRIYRDGTQIADERLAASLPVGDAPAFQLGGNPTYGRYFPGAMDEVRVYDRALSATEIHAISSRQHP